MGSTPRPGAVGIAELTIPGLLSPIETALKAVSWSLVAVAAGMVIAAR